MGRLRLLELTGITLFLVSFLDSISDRFVIFLAVHESPVFVHHEVIECHRSTFRAECEVGQ